MSLSGTHLNISSSPKVRGSITSSNNLQSLRNLQNTISYVFPFVMSFHSVFAARRNIEVSTLIKQAIVNKDIDIVSMSTKYNLVAAISSGFFAASLNMFMVW